MVTAAKVVSLPIWTAVACKQVSLPLCVCGGSVGGLVMQCAARASRQRSHSPARVTLLCPSPPSGCHRYKVGPEGARCQSVSVSRTRRPSLGVINLAACKRPVTTRPHAHTHPPLTHVPGGGGDGYKQGLQVALCKLLALGMRKKNKETGFTFLVFPRCGWTEGWRRDWRDRPPRCRSRRARSVTVHSAPLLFMIDVAPASRARLTSTLAGRGGRVAADHRNRGRRFCRQ